MERRCDALERDLEEEDLFFSSPCESGSGPETGRMEQPYGQAGVAGVFGLDRGPDRAAPQRGRAKSAGLVSERCQNRSGSVWLMEAQAQDRMATARARGLVGGSFQPEEGRHYVTPVAHLAITRARV